MRTPLLGVVMAGGRSSRMGRDKALLCEKGEAWWQRQTRILAASGADPVWLSRRGGQVVPEGCMCIHDLVTDRGPLAGIQAALKASPHPLVALLATDMPELGPDWFRALAVHCTPARGALWRNAEGFLEPLAAIWPRTALSGVEEALAAGEGSLQRLCGRLLNKRLLLEMPLPPLFQGQAASRNQPGDGLPTPASGE